MDKEEFIARVTTAHGTFDVVATKTGLRDTGTLPKDAWVELTTPEKDEKGHHRIVRIRQLDIYVIEYYDSDVVNLDAPAPE